MKYMYETVGSRKPINFFCFDFWFSSDFKIAWMCLGARHHITMHTWSTCQQIQHKLTLPIIPQQKILKYLIKLGLWPPSLLSNVCARVS